MTTQLTAELNRQFHLEYTSSYLYLAMAATFDAQGFKGLSNWMKTQAKEELGHAMSFYNFVYSRNESITLQGIETPQATWPSIKATFEAALEHEQKVTQSIHALIQLAISLHDHATHHFLLGFATEQVEEENTIRDILQKLDLIGNNPMGLIMLDKELGSRA